MADWAACHICQTRTAGIIGSLVDKVLVSAGASTTSTHFAWCPQRRPVLSEPVKDRREALFCARCADHRRQLRSPQVMPEYVRLFVTAHPKHSPSFIENQLNGITRRAVGAEFLRMPAVWSHSYFAATAGGVSAG
jgi:putative transposase